MSCDMFLRSCCHGVRGAGAERGQTVSPRTLTCVASTKDVKVRNAKGAGDRLGKGPDAAAAPVLPGGWTMSALGVVAAVWVGLQLDGLRNLLRRVVVDDPMGVVQLVIYLSGIIVGSVFAGAVAGLALRWFGKPGTWGARLPRYAVGAAGGLVVGLAVGGFTFWIFAEKPAVAGLVGGVLAVTAVLGGLVSAVRPPIMVTAGLLGGTVLLAVWFVRGYEPVKDALIDLFDFGDSARDQLNAYGWYGLSTALFAGVVAGLVVHVYLRRRGGRLPLFAHLFAGALPGLMWVVAELSVWAVGNQLLSFGGELSFLDETSVSVASESQFNGALAVLFAGAMTALLAVGLLTPKPQAGKGARTVPAARTGAAKGAGKPTGKAAKGGAPASRKAAERRAERHAGEEESDTSAKPVGAKPANPAPRKARPAQKGRTTQGRGRPGSRS